MEVPSKLILTRRSVLVGGATVGAGAIALATTGSINSAAAPRRLDPGNGPIPLAIVMDDNATMIDFAGPWEVFQDAPVASVPGFDLFTVAATLDQRQTTGNMKGSGADMHMAGMKFTPDYTFDNAPQPRVIVIGAQANVSEPAKMNWIRRAAVGADLVMSVCTGAFVLASTGLLDGLNATTHHNFFEMFATKFPKVNLERGRRFVDNGKFVTAGGLTSGVDAALHVVERYYGPQIAQQVADYMEYQSAGWKV